MRTDRKSACAFPAVIAGTHWQSNSAAGAGLIRVLQEVGDAVALIARSQRAAARATMAVTTTVALGEARMHQRRTTLVVRLNGGQISIGEDDVESLHPVTVVKDVLLYPLFDLGRDLPIQRRKIPKARRPLPRPDDDFVQLVQNPIDRVGFLWQGRILTDSLSHAWLGKVAGTCVRTSPASV